MRRGKSSRSIPKAYRKGKRKGGDVKEQNGAVQVVEVEDPEGGDQPC